MGKPGQERKSAFGGKERTRLYVGSIGYEYIRLEDISNHNKFYRSSIVISNMVDAKGQTAGGA